ncbi:MAG TPA: hypothetical protein VK515_03675 [Rhizomicrobium sp.]|nr:hypothetical protein [Rhizomicrobium sp.]
MRSKLHCRIFSAVLALTLGWPGLVFAQAAGPKPAAPPESITVTGIKEVEAAVGKFVGTMTVRTHVADKIARWRVGICPILAGLRPEAAQFVIKRLKDVAAQVGAPVNDKTPCSPNLGIVFSTTPQALLNNTRALHPVLLGYHNNGAQAERLAVVTHPIQAWYTTGTQDLNASLTVDNGVCRGETLQMDAANVGTGIDTAFGASSVPFTTMYLPCANAYAVTGNRLGNGLSSELYRVFIVAEPAKLLDYEIGTLSDYIAMLALSQIQPPDSCQDLPSILNLLVPGCSRTAKALTSGDIAYLRGLYKISAGATFGVQQDELISQMNRSLEARQ